MMGSRVQTPIYFPAGELAVVGSRATTPIQGLPFPPSRAPSRVGRAAKRRESMVLNTPPNIAGAWEPSYDEVLARVREDAKAVSDEEIPMEEDMPTPRDEEPAEEEVEAEKPLQQFHTLPAPKTRPWMRRKTMYGDGK